jgi:hypothetical protein
MLLYPFCRNFIDKNANLGKEISASLAPACAGAWISLTIFSPTPKNPEREKCHRATAGIYADIPEIRVSRRNKYLMEFIRRCVQKNDR